MPQLKSILVSQPQPENNKSPYFDLAKKYDIKVDFRSFIHVEALKATEVRNAKINVKEYTAIILTSRNAVDHFFRICEEMRYEVPNTLKYFCTTEATAVYLQKYVVYRKRKIFHGKNTINDLKDLLKKNKKETFLLPTSDILKPIIPDSLAEIGVNYTRAVLYKTVHSDLSDLENVFYDLLVFYSPAGIESLYKNFPNFKQNNTLIAVYGDTTKQAAESTGIKVNIAAPQDNPSMTGAIEAYIKAQKK